MAVLAFLLASLAVSSACPTVTVRVAVSQPKEEAPAVDQNQLLPGGPAPAESTGKMGTGRKTQTTTTLVAVAPSAVKADSGLNHANDFRLDYALPYVSPLEQSTACASIVLAVVSTERAKQLTLVGAKPSGTM